MPYYGDSVAFVGDTVYSRFDDCQQSSQVIFLLETPLAFIYNDHVLVYRATTEGQLVLLNDNVIP